MSESGASWFHRHRRLVAGGAIVAATLVAPGPAEAVPAGDEISWANCGPGSLPGVLCATIEVPLDHKRPKGTKITLALAKLPALDQSNRIGPLLFNPGGPGGSGVAAVAFSDLTAIAPEFAPLRQKFDLIGFDPRGVGASTPINCPKPLHDPAISTFPRTAAAFDQLKQFNRAAGRACRDATGPLIDHVDTGSVVEDVELLRQALGAKKISWLGLSYGTEIGSLYARKYPNRVRAMVLDGVVDHSIPARLAALDEVRATEKALQRFSAWCQTSDQCVLRGTDVIAVWDAIMRGQGVTAANLGRVATAEELANGAYTFLSQPSVWPLLAGALAQAAGLAGAADASGLVSTASFLQPEYDAFRTVGCHDFAPDTHTFPDMALQSLVLRVAAPHTSRYSEYWDWTSGCLGWPVAPANPPAALSVHGAPPILLVNTKYDPATPYVWAQRLASRIDGSRLLTVDGDGHTGILNSACARSHEAEYLVTGKVPAAGVVCGTDTSGAVAKAITGGRFR